MPAEVRGGSVKEILPAISQVLDVAVSCVSSVDPADLPAVVKFILQQISSKRSYEVCVWRAGKSFIIFMV